MAVLCRGIVPIESAQLTETAVSGITSDSRKVKPGDLFVAVSGFQTDGHRFVEQAVQKGAVAVVVEREVGSMAVPVLRSENSRKALALLSDRFFGHPSGKLWVVGITGTNGKTTTGYLLESIFNQAGMEAGLIGTVTYRWKGSETAADRTTPDAVEIHRMMAQMVDAGVKVVVMEVSSHALALDRVQGIPFKAAVFTNLSRDHLDFHVSLEEYGEVKSRLFGMLSSGGVAVINGDDPAGRLMRRTVLERAVLYGENGPNMDYRIHEIEESISGTRFVIQKGKAGIPVSTPLWGKFNVMNVTASVVTGLELGLKDEVIQKGVFKIRRVPGRMEGIASSMGFRVIVDYAHTPDALGNVLKTAREFTTGRLLVVFGCGGDRDRGKRPEMGRIASLAADRVFVTSDNPRTEDPDAIISDILGGISPSKAPVIQPDRKKAICLALDEARKRDTVVVAGKGHETYQEINGKRFPFDDRTVVEKCLKHLEEK